MKTSVVRKYDVLQRYWLEVTVWLDQEKILIWRCWHNLNYKKKMYRFLQCTSMNIVVETHPQVLFAMHLYSVWYLVMSVMFIKFPSKTWPLLTSSQKIFIGRVSVVTLQAFVTCLPSMTVKFWTCSTEGGSTENKFQDVTWCRYSFLSKKRNRKNKSYSFEHNSFQFSIMMTYLNTLLINAFEKWKSRKLLDWGFWLC